MGKNNKQKYKQKSLNLAEDGSYSVDGHKQSLEYDDDGLHIGNLNQVEENTILSNLYGSYLGPNNPKGKDGDYYAFPPINDLDYAAFKHDRDYDKIGARGPLDAIFNPQTKEADRQLIRRAAEFLKGNRSGRATLMAHKTATSFTFLFFIKICQTL